MSNKIKKKPEPKVQKGKRYILPILLFAILVVCATMIFLTNRNRKSNLKAKQEVKKTETIVAGESLEIPIADITTDASFFSAEVNGTTMEVVAVKDNEGNIRTAFNTCQICYSSGRGYYKQSGNYLVCQNCGNSFSMDQVEVKTGGCNPWPIFEDNKTVTDDKIMISYDFLTESQKIFENWKTNL